MDIEATKLELMQLLLNTNKESTLLRIKHIYQEESSDWWSELSIQEQEEIKEGILQERNGETISHKNVMKHFDKWK